MADREMVKLAILQRIGQLFAQGAGGVLRGVHRAILGKKTTKGALPNLMRKRVEGQGRKFTGAYRVPRYARNDPQGRGWKVVSKDEYGRLKGSGNVPGRHLQEVKTPSGDTIYRTRTKGFDPKSIAGFTERHPKMVAGAGLGAYFLWDPVKQTYQRSSDTMSGRGPSSGYYLPSQGV